jgi:hypothetical protein
MSIRNPYKPVASVIKAIPERTGRNKLMHKVTVEVGVKVMSQGTSAQVHVCMEEEALEGKKFCAVATRTFINNKTKPLSNWIEEELALELCAKIQEAFRRVISPDTVQAYKDAAIDFLKSKDTHQKLDAIPLS